VLIMPIPENIYLEFDEILEIPRSNKDCLFLALDEVISHIQSLLLTPEYSISSSEKAELLYLIGYAYYHYPDRDNGRDIYANIEKYLSLAVEIDADYSIAWLYLGHNAYDTGQYNIARERFLKCQEEHFNSFYRLVLMEMKLCTSIKMEGLTVMIVEVGKFIDLLENHDTTEDIFPYVLTSILQGNSMILEDSSKKEVDNLLLRLRNI
jgi:tetratricopeptide (TPR) repeat protein